MGTPSLVPVTVRPLYRPYSPKAHSPGWGGGQGDKDLSTASSPIFPSVSCDHSRSHSIVYLDERMTFGY